MKYIKRFKLNESDSQLDQLIEMVKAGQFDMAEMMAIGLGLITKLEQALKLEYSKLATLLGYFLYKTEDYSIIEIIKQINSIKKANFYDIPGSLKHTLPQVLVNLQSLEHLYLNGWSLTDRDFNIITKLKNLKTLDLSYSNLPRKSNKANSLSYLPHTISSLKNLEELYLRGVENIYELPESIIKLNNLSILDLRDSSLDVQYDSNSEFSSPDDRKRAQEIWDLEKKMPNCNIRYTPPF